MMRKMISLDWLAVIAALLLGAAVKFGMLGHIPW